MYTQYFGLSGKPFQLSPDANFFFPSREHNRALAFLDYGIDQADGFIVITGDVGTGKTTILQTLLQRLDSEELMVSTVVTTQLEQDDLLYLVAANLGIDIDGTSKAILLHKIEKLLHKQFEAGRRVLLIIDEAQNLPPGAVEELRMLSNYQSNGRPLVQIFLVGQSELRATLLSPGFEQLRQRVIATYHLNPLDEEETRTYIEHRLSLVGWELDPELTEDAFPAIFDATDGIPRRINNLCDRLLLYAFLEEMHQIDSEVVRVVSEEIGSEFSAGLGGAEEQRRGRDDDDLDDEPPVSDGVFDRPGQQLETMARHMFDKADVQQRLSRLERSVDSLGEQLRPELRALNAEVARIRELLEAALNGEQPDRSDSSTKRRA